MPYHESHTAGPYGLGPLSHDFHCHVVRLRGHRPLTTEDFEFNRRQDVAREIRHARTALSKSLNDQTFIIQSLSFLVHKAAGGYHGEHHQMHRRDQSYEDVDRALNAEEERRSIAVRQRDVDLTRPALLSTLNFLASSIKVHTASRITGDIPENGAPECFLHAWRPSSHTFHDDKLGIRSTDLLTPPEYDAPTLRESSNLSADGLRNHCEGSEPSCFISLSDSPGRTHKWIASTWQFKDIDRGMVAIVNTSKLLEMGVLCNRTTTLALRLSMPLWKADPNKGLSYANENFWVAYRWIPEECMEYYISSAYFLRFCHQQGIGTFCNGRADHDKLTSTRTV